MQRSLWLVIDIAFLLVVWGVVAAFVPGAAYVLPPIPDVAKKALELVYSGSLGRDIIASLSRTFAGFSIAVATALPFGIFLGRMPRVARSIDPLIEVLRPISPIAWIPISILWFGIGEVSKLFIIWQIAFFFILLNTVAGVRSIDKTLVEAGRTLGAGRVFLLFNVVLPAALPQILVGLRLGLAVSIGGVILAEMIAAQNGLGVLIERSRETLSPAPMIVGIVTIAIFGYAANQLMLLVERRWMKHRSATQMH